MVEYAPLDRVERLHTEQKAVHEKIVRAEVRLDQHDARLHEGAVSFNELREAITALRDEVRPKPLPWWQLVMIIVAIVGTFGGGATVLFRAPSRDEFRELQREMQGVRENLAGVGVKIDTLTRQTAP